MKEFILKFSIVYRLYQNLVRKNNHEYDFFKFMFKIIGKKKIRVLDLCCGDSYILRYTGNYINNYLGYDNNQHYLNQNKKKWKKFKFIYGNLNDLKKQKRILKFKPNLIFMNGAIHHLNNDLVKKITDMIKSKFKNAVFISVDPIKKNNKLLNQLMIKFDRGQYIRNNKDYKKIMKNFNSFIVDDFYKMSFLNIFHFRNINLKNLYLKWKHGIEH